MPPHPMPHPHNVSLRMAKCVWISNKPGSLLFADIPRRDGKKESICGASSHVLFLFFYGQQMDIINCGK